MPIYAYRCQSCGFAKDVLQKLSDAPLSDCPECKQPSFKKQLTAAGFQLKGTGWYATDFRGGTTAAPAAGATTSAGEPAAAATSESATTSTAADSKPSTLPASPPPSASST